MIREHADVLKLVAEVSGTRATDVTSETDLFQAGVIDSLSLVVLISRLEDQFGIEFGADLLVVDNFQTPAAIARTVHEVRRNLP